MLLGGLELGAWVYLRRDGLARALLPTDAPYWLDRAVSAGAGVAAVVAVIAGGIGLFQLPGTAAPEPLITRQRSASAVTTWGRQKRK